MPLKKKKKYYANVYKYKTYDNEADYFLGAMFTNKKDADDQAKSDSKFIKTISFTL